MFPRLGARALRVRDVALRSGAPPTVRRSMSVFAPNAVNPIFDRKVVAEMASNGEIDKFIGTQFKPPMIDEICSSYYDPLVRKFTNHLMRNGDKILARRIMDGAFEKIKRVQIEKYHLTTDPEEKNKIELDPRTIFRTAVANGQPVLELTPVRRGGVTYQVPVPVLPNRARFLSIKWFIEAAGDKDDKIRVWDKLALELLDAFRNEGKVIKRKQDLHRQCEANRAYAHYRWT